MPDKNQQELLFKLSMFEQEIQQIQQQLNSVEQGIVELGSLNLEIDGLTDSEGKEVLAPIGKGIFAKTKLISEDLVIDIGNKTFVKKTIPETQGAIKEQIKRLEEVKIELNENLESANEEVQRVIESAEQGSKN